MISLIRLFPLLGELHVVELSVKIPVMQLHLVHFILYVHQSLFRDEQPSGLTFGWMGCHNSSYSTTMVLSDVYGYYFTQHHSIRVLILIWSTNRVSFINWWPSCYVRYHYSEACMWGGILLLKFQSCNSKGSEWYSLITLYLISLY